MLSFDLYFLLSPCPINMNSMRVETVSGWFSFEAQETNIVEYVNVWIICINKLMLLYRSIITGYKSYSLLVRTLKASKVSLSQETSHLCPITRTVNTSQIITIARYYIYLVFYLAFSWNFHSYLVRVAFIIPIFWKGNWGSERSSNLSKITQ